MSPDKLAYMANQIGKFFSHQKHDQAVASIEDHLRKFWDPRMRSTILAQYDAVKSRLDPLVQQAVERLHK
jgi:formate dehydrogenase subunit delta